MKLLANKPKIIKYIYRIERILRNHYQPSNLGNKKNPLNELLYIIISLRTTNPSLQRNYLKFKKLYPKWDDAYKAKVISIARVLKTAGLSMQKAHNLKRILLKIKKDWGILSLRKLKKLDNTCLEEYLLSLPGIGLKSARCIMMYSFAREVFPVDSHCFRIIKRLGWIPSYSKNNINIQNDIQKLIPLRLRYRLHVNLIQHGRAVCFPYRPRCRLCFLNNHCKYAKTKKR